MKRRSLILFAVSALFLAAHYGLAQGANRLPADLELAVGKGLDYLAATQTKEGCWPGSYGSGAGVVGLGVMTYLAHGEVPGEGKYRVTIKKAVNYILSKQVKNGNIGGSMYNHGFATMALAEVYGQMAEEDERIGVALKKAVDLIVDAQNDRGGWRYGTKSKDADVTVTGCQMMALRAAAGAGMEVPAETIRRGAGYIRTRACASGGFGYTSPSGPTTACSSIGVLVLSLSGYYRTPEVRAGADYLRANGFSSSSYHYALYYTSQAMFQAGGRYWREWNTANKENQVIAQLGDGSWGSANGENGFATIMTLLSLEVNWKLLPIYQR